MLDSLKPLSAHALRGQHSFPLHRRMPELQEQEHSQQIRGISYPPLSSTH